MKDGQKCVVNGCENRHGNGRFVGDICSPCYMTLTSGIVGNGNSFINKLYSKARHSELLIGEVKRHHQDVMNLLDTHVNFKSTTNARYAKRYAIVRDMAAYDLSIKDLLVDKSEGIGVRQGDDLDHFLDSKT